jgi:hypothetical protein
VSRVSYDPLKPYLAGERAASRINAIFDAIETAGASLDAGNYAEEGFDASRFTGAIPCEVVEEVGSAVRTSTATSGAFAQLTVGATNLRTAAITLLTGEILLLLGRVQLESTVSSGLGLANSRLEIRLAQTVAAVTTAITGTKRRQTRAALAGDLTHHNTLRTFGWVVGPASLDDVRIQYLLVGAAANVGVGHLLALRYRRVT